VIDTGSGVPEHLRESIFEPFMQGPQAGASGQAGTGLGLYISRRLSETFGGTVYCKPNTAAGRGSIFSLELNLTLRQDCTIATSYHCTPWASNNTLFATLSPSSLISRTLSPTFSNQVNNTILANTISSTASSPSHSIRSVGSGSDASPQYGPSLASVSSSPMILPRRAVYMTNSNGSSHDSKRPPRSVGSYSPSPVSPPSDSMNESDQAVSSPILRSTTLSISSRDDGTLSSRSGSSTSSKEGRPNSNRRIRLATVHSGSSDRLNRFQLMDNITVAAAAAAAASSSQDGKESNASGSSNSNTSTAAEALSDDTSNNDYE
jgi:hypothetical protein